MVFLALTAQGLAEAMALAKLTGSPIWCSANAISAEGYAALSGLDISRFEYEIEDLGDPSLGDALRTIEEHHPGHRIWIQHALSQMQ